ncbi:hypothetical protein [Longimicrobium sp.]|uniref:hypothetical protein n=1 Tax=Longimicrobium sp. TaxID=2029185 RepID=UPI002E36A2DB|nr:hypothetical protein [Longimicrobium sp.]HEX6039388.1 hypothetical protein [Longimicrobium sp.]
MTIYLLAATAAVAAGWALRRYTAPPCPRCKHRDWDIGGDARRTSPFVHRGEPVLTHLAELTTSRALAWKDWYDTDNDSHGGPVPALVAP